MFPYSRGLTFDNSNDYGIVKTEAVFGFGRRGPNNLNLNDTDPLQWLITPVSLERRSMLEDDYDILKESSRALKRKETGKKSGKKRKGKGKKCVYKIINKNKKNRRKNKYESMKKKYMLPLIIGLLAAKSVLIPIAFKALAFLSAKGFLMGFFSTILASFLSIKGMFDNNHRYQDRKDEKTQLEIIQVPTPTKEDHYYDDHYRKSEYLPMIA